MSEGDEGDSDEGDSDALETVADLLTIAAMIPGLASEGEEGFDPKSLLSHPSPGSKRARAAFQRLFPLRLERYRAHLVGRCVMGGRDRLVAAVPLTIALGVSLLKDRTVLVRKTWTALADLAGVAGAEWLVVELLTATEFVPVARFEEVMSYWAEAATVARDVDSLPACMAVEERTGPIVRRRRRR